MQVYNQSQILLIYDQSFLLGPYGHVLINDSFASQTIKQTTISWASTLVLNWDDC